MSDSEDKIDKALRRSCFIVDLKLLLILDNFENDLSEEVLATGIAK